MTAAGFPRADVLAYQRINNTTGAIQPFNPTTGAGAGTYVGQLANGNGPKAGANLGIVLAWIAAKNAGTISPATGQPYVGRNDKLAISWCGWNGSYASENSMLALADFSVTSGTATISNGRNASGAVLPAVILATDTLLDLRSAPGGQRAISTLSSGGTGNVTSTAIVRPAAPDITAQTQKPIIDARLSHSALYLPNVAPFATNPGSGTNTACLVQTQQNYTNFYNLLVAKTAAESLILTPIGGYASLGGNDRTWPQAYNDFTTAENARYDYIKANWPGQSAAKFVTMRTPVAGAAGNTGAIGAQSIFAQQVALRAARSDIVGLLTTDDIVRGSDTEHFVMGGYDETRAYSSVPKGPLCMGQRLFDQVYKGAAVGVI